MARSRNFCFTINNYTQDDIERINNLECMYMAHSLEVGDSGTPHIQGYLELHNASTITALSKKLVRAHIEISKGSAEQNKAYCSKNNNTTFTERGTPKQQGKRNDLKEIKEKLKSGTLKIREVVLETQNMQQIRHAEILLKYHEKKRDFKPTVKWYYGSTGSGKTRQAVEELGEDYYSVMRNVKWWEGYDGHEAVLIDDLRSNMINFVDLLVLLDRYAYRVETKGGSRQLLAKTIIITSPMSPVAMFSTSGENIQQLIRRIDEIKRFGELETELDEFNEL